MEERYVFVLTDREAENVYQIVRRTGREELAKKFDEGGGARLDDVVKTLEEIVNRTRKDIEAL